MFLKQNCMKKIYFLLNVPVLLLCGALLASCSKEEGVKPKPEPSNEFLDPARYILPAIVAPQKEGTTKGMPVHAEAEMVDFAFFSSYTGLSGWNMATHAPAKMFNRQMVSYYDNHPYAHVLLWKYADAARPVLWETASTASAADRYTFFGYAPYATGAYHATTNPLGNGIVVTSVATDPGVPGLSYTVPVKVENHPDFMVADTVQNLVPTGHPVPMHLNHALTAIALRIAGKNQEKITKITLVDVHASGNLKMNGAHLNWMLDPMSNVDLTASIKFDAGIPPLPAVQYRTATTTFTNPFNPKTNDDPAKGWLMMPPQTLLSTSKVKIELEGGATREVLLGVNSSGNAIKWEAGKRIPYTIYMTPSGTKRVLPDNTQLPFMAQAPAASYLVVVCEQFDGAPDPTENWTLTVQPPANTWLRLTLNPNGTGASSTVSGTGTQPVYLVTLSSNTGAAARVADLSLNGVTGAATVTQTPFPTAGFSGWLYVKQGATGAGFSWSDAAPTIQDALACATLLLGASPAIPIHGILVAGGSGRCYTDTPYITSGIRMFGGWEGLAGTELSNNAHAAYTSVHRNLATWKAVITPPDGLVVSGTGSALDGFIVRDMTTINPCVTVNNGAYIHAVEVVRNAVAATTTPVLSVSGGNSMAINVLVADNAGPVVVTGGAKLVNATIVNNIGGFIQNSAVLNTVWWGNGTPVLMGNNTIQNSAFPDGSTPAGTGNIALNANNIAWFTPSNLVPGPQFAANAIPGKPFYSALSNRAPMLGRGDQGLFDGNAAFIPVGVPKTDILGNPRHVLDTDMGCYEDAGFEGFKLRWASDRVYIGANDGYITDIPLLLPGNETLGVGVQWTVTPVGTLNYCRMVQSPPIVMGSGTGVLLGTVQMTTMGSYVQNAERLCGRLMVHTNLGGYLPDVTLEVWQIPGSPAPWTMGYVGSFHRNNERGARIISGSNTGAYTVRIVNGLEWIKIDNRPRDDGADILSEPNPGGVGGYKKEVEEVFGGVITGTGDIRFRVGLKSANPHPAQPRYGLIVITRTGGIAWFYVRQGEAADYLYRSTDPRVVGGTDLGRSSVVKFSPFSMTDPQSNANAAGRSVGYRGARPVAYPTQFGYFFQWNRMVAYRLGAGTVASGAGETAYSAAREICPVGYRQGTFAEWIHTLYWKSDATPGAGDQNINPTQGDALLNYLEGCYADGFYDALVGNLPNQLPPPTSNDATAILGTAHEQAFRGVLMVNHYNYAGIFFPTISGMNAGGSTYTQIGFSRNFMADLRVAPSSRAGEPNTAHWGNSHIGINCYTSTLTSYATPVRCVVE